MPKMNIYRGSRLSTGTDVTVNGQPLNMRFDLRKHSPGGFEWGYGGSGPAQLALAILAHEYDDKIASYFYQDFKEQIVATLRGNEWLLTSNQIEAAMTEITLETAGSRVQTVVV